MSGKCIIGNWKMNGRWNANAVFFQTLRTQMVAFNISLPILGAGLCVPFPYMHQAKLALAGTSLSIGAQDVSLHASGAFTGEVSAAMLKDLGVVYSLVGHSERRLYHGETNAIVAAKARAAQAEGILPIVCIGEALAERQAGQTQAVLSAQLVPIVAALLPQKSTWLLAYEPVWAIGTGCHARPEQIQAVHAHLRAQLQQAKMSFIPILYGGSVTPDNAPDILAQPDVDGVLVGGASLKVEDFTALLRMAYVRPSVN